MSGDPDCSQDDQVPGDILEVFENEWQAGHVPDLLRFVECCTGSDAVSTVLELIQIDMERRWQSGQGELRRMLPQYLEQLPPLFSGEHILELICWEFRIRHQCGDCISRRKVCEQYPQLGDALSERLMETSRLMDWPQVSVLIDGRAAVTVPLDRDIEVGRQQFGDPHPVAAHSTKYMHRIVVSEMNDASLSRQQLLLSRNTPGTVSLWNRSGNRAIAVRGEGAIAPGSGTTFQLPVFVHLGGSRYLRICESPTS